MTGSIPVEKKGDGNMVSIPSSHVNDLADIPKDAKMKVGDLVRNGDEIGIILSLWCQEGAYEGEVELIADCLWSNGDIDWSDADDLEPIK